MRRKVRRVIAVQQVKFYPTHLHFPRAQPDGVTGQNDLQSQPLAVRLAQRRDRQLARVVIRIKRLLRAIVVNHLTEITLLVKQPHTDHRHTEIACSLELIAGHIAQSTGVNRQCLAQHVFHAEIRDALQRRLRMLFLKPRGRICRLPLGFQPIVHLLAKDWIGERGFELVLGNRLQHHPGILRELPQRGIKLPPHLVGGMIPRPAQVQRQLRKRIVAFNVRVQRVVVCLANRCFFVHGF